MTRARLAAVAGITAAVAFAAAPMAQAADSPASAARPAGAHIAFVSWRVLKEQHFPGRNAGFAWVVALPHGNAWTFGETGEVAAYTGAPLAAYWDGSHWSARALPADSHCGPVTAVSAPSGGDIWIAGVNGCVLHFDGTSWKVARNWPSGRQLTGVVALSARNVWVFGATAAPAGKAGDGTWHYNGSSWKQVHGIGGEAGIACAASPHDIWAIGVSSHRNVLSSFVERYNGSIWRRVASPVLRDPQQIFASSRSGVWLIGQALHGRGLALAYRKSARWHKVPVPGTAAPQQLIADGSGGIWISAISINGSANLILHRSATAWLSSSGISSATSDFLGGLALVPGSRAVLAVGTVMVSKRQDAVIYATGTF
jgi:hypothetical protein